MNGMNIATAQAQRADEARLQITLANMAAEREQKRNEAENSRKKDELDAQTRAIELNNEAEVAVANAANERAKIKADANDKLVAQENKRQLGMLQHEGKTESVRYTHEVNMKNMLLEDKKVTWTTF